MEVLGCTLVSEEGIVVHFLWFELPQTRRCHSVFASWLRQGNFMHFWYIIVFQMGGGDICGKLVPKFLFYLFFSLIGKMRKRSLQDADYFLFFFLHRVETYNYSVKAKSDVIHCSIGKRPLFCLSLSPSLSVWH